MSVTENVSHEDAVRQAIAAGDYWALVRLYDGASKVPRHAIEACLRCALRLPPASRKPPCFSLGDCHITTGPTRKTDQLRTMVMVLGESACAYEVLEELKDSDPEEAGKLLLDLYKAKHIELLSTEEEMDDALADLDRELTAARL